MAAQLLTDAKIAGEIARINKAREANKKAGAAHTRPRRHLLDSKVHGLALRITPNGAATSNVDIKLPVGDRPRHGGSSSSCQGA
jgi:hypothetical protein